MLSSWFLEIMLNREFLLVFLAPIRSRITESKLKLDTKKKAIGGLRKPDVKGDSTID